MTATEAEFRELFASVSNWGRWGADDVRGTLNTIDEGSVQRAVSAMGIGRSVSCSRPLGLSVNRPRALVEAQIDEGLPVVVVPPEEDLAADSACPCARSACARFPTLSAQVASPITRIPLSRIT